MSISDSRNENNTDMQKKVDNCCTANEEDAVKVIQEFEEIIKNKKSDII